MVAVRNAADGASRALFVAALTCCSTVLLLVLVLGRSILICSLTGLIACAVMNVENRLLPEPEIANDAMVATMWTSHKGSPCLDS